MKASIIDLGYNSIKLVNYNILQKNKKYRAYYDKSIRVQLGEGMHKVNVLQSDAMERTIESIKYFKEIISTESIDYVIPFATSAVREAENKKIFLNHVEEQTGLKFRILTTEQEAFYSYLGALNSLCIPNCLFFDLGGGSIEIVYAENYKIKKMISLPLGSLKLTQFFSRNNVRNRNKESVENSYLELQNYLLDSLPTRKELGINIDSLMLVGVGGTLRALARYDQLIKEYPLKKLQNYNLKYSSLTVIKDHLLGMSPKEISGIDVIGSNRAETITTGLYTIYLLMAKLNFQNLIVSTNGIREGVLLDFIHSLENSSSSNNTTNYKTQYTKLNNYLIKNCLKTSSSFIVPTFISQLLSFEILNKYEHDILVKAFLYLPKISNTISYLGKFHFLLDEDIPNINHEQQLILALSLISIYKPKISSEIAESYTSLLHSYSKKGAKKIVEKISVCLQLYKIMQKNKYIKIIKFNKEDRKMLISITFQKESTNCDIFLKEVLKNFATLFNISIKYNYIQYEKEIRS
jgi:exopolyphosphatase/guanosine-5'-triphosphate,3'-diphosphate pyrophosphatase